MSKLELVQGEITHTRFGMGVLIAILFSMVGYIVANLETGETIKLILALVLLLVSSTVLLILQRKIKKQIQSLGDL